MTSKPEATRRTQPASTRVVRIELNLKGVEHVVEANLDMLRASTLSHRRAESMVWDFGDARVIVDEEGAEALLTGSLSVISDERKWRVVETVLEDLERSGFLLRKRQ